MDKYEEIMEVVEIMHQISFYDVIKHNHNGQFRAPEIPKGSVSGYCQRCDEYSYPVDENGNRVENSDFKLNNISHGSHTYDFLCSMNLSDEEIHEKISEWSDEPVLFLMENPSYDYDIYDYAKNDSGHSGKRPAKNWYWIHSGMGDYCDYSDSDMYLKHSEYGRMVASLICQFGIGNAYLTNIVKCGMTDAKYVDDEKRNNVVETGFYNLDNYPEACKRTCVTSVLEEEIKALCKNNSQLRVFAFGERPYWLMRDYLENGCKIEGLEYQLLQLPHPANRLKDNYRKYVLKGIVGECLKDQTFTAVSGDRKILNEELVRNVFYECFSSYSLGSRVTNNQYALKVIMRDSVFADAKFSKEVIVRGRSDTEPKNWGLGYVFLTDEEWAWDYDKDEYIDKSVIPCHECFDKAIFELLQ